MVEILKAAYPIELSAVLHFIDFKSKHTEVGLELVNGIDVDVLLVNQIIGTLDPDGQGKADSSNNEDNGDETGKNQAEPAADPRVKLCWRGRLMHAPWTRRLHLAKGVQFLRCRARTAPCFWLNHSALFHEITQPPGPTARALMGQKYFQLLSFESLLVYDFDCIRNPVTANRLAILAVQGFRVEVGDARSIPRALIVQPAMASS